MSYTVTISQTITIWKFTSWCFPVVFHRIPFMYTWCSPDLWKRKSCSEISGGKCLKNIPENPVNLCANICTYNWLYSSTLFRNNLLNTNKCNEEWNMRSYICKHVKALVLMFLYFFRFVNFGERINASAAEMFHQHVYVCVCLCVFLYYCICVSAQRLTAHVRRPLWHPW